MNSASKMNDVSKLRNEVQEVYANVAEAPEGDFHFHRGAGMDLLLAAKRVGKSGKAMRNRFPWKMRASTS